MHIKHTLPDVELFQVLMSKDAVSRDLRHQARRVALAGIVKNCSKQSRSWYEQEVALYSALLKRACSKVLLAELVLKSRGKPIENPRLISYIPSSPWGEDSILPPIPGEYNPFGIP